MKKENNHFAVFDIESNDWIKFEVLGFFDGNTYKSFNKITKFLEYINCRKYRNYRIFAHNGGKFDFLFLLEPIHKLGWKFEIIERSGSCIIIKVKTGKTEFSLCDSYALLPESLKKLGEGFNTTHRKKDFDITKGADRHDPVLMEYLRNDCYCLYEVLETFYANDYIVEPQLTIASQALNTYRKLFMKCEMFRMKLHDEELIRDRFYSGGRVEVYKGYGKNIRAYDVNSLYPHAMLNEMPCGTPKDVSTYQKGKIGFYKVYLKNVPRFYISPLLSKIEVKGSPKNYYTNGEGYYYLSSETLDYLVKEFAIKFRVEFGIVFPKREDIFRKYVETFYKIKSESRGSALYQIAKYFLNALYGKLGQSRWKDTIKFYEKGMKNFTSYDDTYGLVMVSKESHNKFILPYLASYITECARLHHFKLMNLNPQSLFYCDTDSLFTSSKEYDELVSPEIGKLSYLGNFEGVFIAPKTYALRTPKEEIITFKGFNPDKFTFNEFKKALHGKLTLQQTRQRVLGFKECTNQERMKREGKKSRVKIIGDEGKYLKLSENVKEAVGRYDKRMIYPDSKHVFNSTPFTLGELL